MKKVDPRVKRTNRLLIDALIELVAEQGYDAVTVREIVKRAEVNRSTFYLHFRDKQDILNCMEDHILNELGESVRNPTFTYESALRNYEASKTPIYSTIALFKHVEKYATLYRKMLVERDFRARVTQVIRKEVLPLTPGDLEAAFASHGIIGVILYWLEGGMKESVQEMSLWLTRFSLYPLRHFE
ncbi:TetR/AcrR family transcriptional regulator [Alicyclobacillus fodiniaquatilis]|uniref:TetR/AcrR family transcriptional regulator n=1 Tax=Alicyclobacillus fodiniaquatilis TaxID=1661150 RepID=A0ABW4JNB6_9BACL